MKKVHRTGCNCSICESKHYNAIAFKSGYVCENCLDFVKSYDSDNKTDVKTELHPPAKL